MQTSLSMRAVFGLALTLLLSIACSRERSPSESSEKSDVTSPPAAAARSAQKDEKRPIVVNGSSTVHPISEGVLELYASRLVTDVKLDVSGTGGGFKLFCRGETDINAASRPISPM